MTLGVSAGAWTVAIRNVAESNISVGDVHLPDQSQLNGASIFPCINSLIGSEMKKEIAGVDFAAALVSVEQ